MRRLQGHKDVARIGGAAARETTHRRDRRIALDDLDELHELLLHRLEGNALVGAQAALHRAFVGRGEETLGHDGDQVEIEHDGDEHHGDDGLGILQRPAQGAAVEILHPLEAAPRPGHQRVLVFLDREIEIGAHHRRQGQRNHHRDDDRDRQGDGEFVEYPPHHAADQQHREEHRHQRDAHGNDGEGHFLGALQRRLHPGLAVLQVTGDVFQNNDRVVDHETGRDDQRHQREIVEAEAEQVHRPESAQQCQRHADGGHQRRLQVPQEQEHNQDHQHGGDDQRHLHVKHRIADGGGGVHQRAELDGGGQRRLQLRHHLADIVHHLDDVGAGLLGDIDQNRRLAVEGAQVADILYPVHHLGHVLQPDRGTIAIRDDQGAVVAGGAGHVIGINLERLFALLNVALGCVGIGRGDRGAHIGQADAVLEQGARVQLNANGGKRRAVERHIAHARNLRQLLLDDIGSLVIDLARRQVLRRHRQDQDREVGRIELAVGRIGPQRSGQIRPRRIDRGLHVSRRAVDVAVDVELQHDLGGIDVAARRHLVDARNGAQVPFQRRGHAGGHNLRAGARHRGIHHNGGNVDIGEGRNWQQGVRDHPRHAQTQRQKRGGNAAADEERGEIHSAGSGTSAPPRRRARQARKSTPSRSK